MNTWIKRILFILACVGLAGVIYVSLFGLPVGTPEPPPLPPSATEVPTPELEPAPEPAPAPEKMAPPIADEGARPDCPDCLKLELALLELGYLNQFLGMLQQAQTNALRLPSGYSEAVMEIVQEQHPLLVPLIPAMFGPPETFSAPAAPSQPTESVDTKEDHTEEIDIIAVPEMIAPVSIEDVRVVYARPGTKERPPRAHINVLETREVIAPGRTVHAGHMELVLVDILPANSAVDGRSRVIVRDRNSSQTYTLEWF